MNNKGFSMVEVLMAMSVLMITFLAAISMNYMTIKLNTTGNMQTMAKNYATALLEEIRCQEAYHMVRGDFHDEPHPAFSRKWSIKDTSTQKMIRINIVVSWKKFGSTKRFTINTVHKTLFVGGESYISGTGNIKM